ncbi:hypothetical protein RhiLY_03945 [Ceratobasidium sp. AG-Ba]|nr:hypothetical protein RhiLY_03945 [Ceratobasidium sp. AG-Ba]
MANKLDPASSPFYPSSTAPLTVQPPAEDPPASPHPGVIGSPALAVRTGLAPTPTASTVNLASGTGLTPTASPYSPYSPYGANRQGSLALSSGSTSPPRLLRTGPQYGSPISRSRSASRENSLNDTHPNGDATADSQALTPQAHTTKSGSVSSSSPPQDYLSANFGTYSIAPGTRTDDRPLTLGVQSGFRSETISPASSVRSLTLADVGSFDAHAKASPFLNDILDRLIRCEYTNRDIHRELQGLTKSVAFLVERADQSGLPLIHQPRDDEIKQLGQRLGIDCFCLAAHGHAGPDAPAEHECWFQCPQPRYTQLGLEQLPPHVMTPGVEPPAWTSAHSAIRGPDKRRSVSSLIRRDSASLGWRLAPQRSRPGNIQMGASSPRTDLLRSIAKYGVGPPNKIQQRALPFLLRGSDIIAQAPPTQERIAAYVIPAIHVALTTMIGYPGSAYDPGSRRAIGVRSALGVGTGGDVVQD